MAGVNVILGLCGGGGERNTSPLRDSELCIVLCPKLPNGRPVLTGSVSARLAGER